MIRGYGLLNIKGGTVSAINHTQGSTAYGVSGKISNINGTKIYVEGQNSIWGLYANYCIGNAKITDTEIEAYYTGTNANYVYGIYFNGGYNATMENIRISVNSKENIGVLRGISTLSSDYLTIKTGTIVAGQSSYSNGIDSVGVYSTHISLGDLSTAANTEDLVIQGEKYGVQSLGPDFKFYNGILKGVTSAYDTVRPPTELRPGYLVETDTEEIDETTYNTAFLSQSIDDNYYLVNAKTGHETLAEAYANSNNDETIVLMKNITDTSTLTMDNTKNITFNTYGNDITLSNPITVNGSTLTIIGNSTIKNNSTNTIEVASGGHLIVKNTSIESSVGDAIHEDGSGSTIQIGIADDPLSTIEPNIKGKTYGINSSNITSCEVNLYNGIIRGETAALTNDLNIENTAGKIRDRYVTERNTDQDNYKYISLRQSNVIITANPLDKKVATGDLSQFSITAVGDEPHSYQWYKQTESNGYKGTAIVGATSNIYTITSTQQGDEAYYYCIVTSNTGDVQASTKAKLTVQNNYSITSSGTTKYFAELVNAIVAASDGQTIQVLQDVTDDSIATIDRSLTLDLQTYTITRTATITINENKTLNLLGTGKITNAKTTTITNSGTLNITTNVTVECTETSTISPYYTIVNLGSAKIEMSNGTIRGYCCGIRNSNCKGTINISGGTIETINTSDTRYGIYNYSTSSSYTPTVNITGGTINVPGASGVQGTQSNYGTGYGIYNYGTYALTTIGSSSTPISKTNPVILGKTYGVYRYNGTVRFYNGILKGISGGYSSSVTKRTGCTIVTNETETIDGTVYKTAYLNDKYTITLNNNNATTPGTTTIYEKYNTGYYLDSSCETQITTASNPITIPKKDGYIFTGYYTTAAGGTQYISSTGHLTSSASKTKFTAAGTLYAHWQEVYLKANTSYSSTGAFLGTSITIDKINKVSFVTSLEGHIVDNTTCWDVSSVANSGAVLMWIKSGNDTDGYEIVIGQNGGVVANPNSSYLFSYIGNSKTSIIDLENFDTSKVTNMNRMFYNCQNVSILDVSRFDTSKVTNMDGMFDGCQNVSTLDVSEFDTSCVTNMDRMFTNCQNVSTLDVSGFNTSCVTSMNRMFTNCQNVSILDVSGFDTSKVTNMYAMFGGCQNVSTLDVSGFDTSNVTSMGLMFDSCYNVSTLDLSGFDTSNVTEMIQMFFDCQELTTIYTSNNFLTTAVTNGNNMFYGDTKLVGGAGTVYNSWYSGLDYAHIDGGTSNPGYFTDASTRPTISAGGTNIKTATDISTLYGQTTTYKSASHPSIDWQLFYADSSNYYLIASDYVPNAELPCNGNTVNGVTYTATDLVKSTSTTNQHAIYGARFASSNSYNDGVLTAGTIYKNGSASTAFTATSGSQYLTTNYLKWVAANSSSTNTNICSVAYMMDTNKWSSFADGVNGAYAIGGPTIEMLSLSWNAVSEHTQMTDYTTLSSSNSNSTGYITQSPENQNNFFGTATNMWFIKETTKAYGYFLASPSSAGVTSVRNGFCEGCVYESISFGQNYGFRPLVAIPRSAIK
ncbi:MAG: BspA family leucine-rich repeat surface protein [Clostridia bacterium]|nr:BspA family leucine-rich repeat surface protein [Clostridia bacterium]